MRGPRMSRYRVEWASEGSVLAAVEPSPDELRRHAPLLRAAYNEAHNREMMGGSEDMTEDDVVEHFDAVKGGGGRPFLLFKDGALVGDADLRDVESTHAEFAIMVAARGDQGKGLGTRFATMLHAFAFRALGLERVYVTIVPQNAASRRVFEKLGYAIDDSPEARAKIDEPDDVSMSVARAAFEKAHGEATRSVRVEELAA